MMQYNVQSL